MRRDTRRVTGTKELESRPGNTYPPVKELSEACVGRCCNPVVRALLEVVAHGIGGTGREVGSFHTKFPARCGTQHRLVTGVPSARGISS